MRLRAVSLKGEFVHFKMSDCPVILSDKTVVLLNRPNSPILQLRSIARGLDDESLFETDFVLDGKDNLLGYVVYDKGFKIYNPKTNDVEPFPEDFKVLPNATVNTIPDTKYQNRVIWFVGKDTPFGIQSIVVAEGDTGYVFSKNLKSIDLSNVKFTTGYRKNNTEICFGDQLSDGYVVMHDNHPMVKTKQGFRELRRDEYDN